MEQLRVGIAGYGVVGKRRRAVLDEHPHCRTVAVCDVSFEHSGAIEDGVKCVSTYKELLEQPLDVVFVCLPNYLAAEVTIASLQKGLHVFCEKPPGRTVADIERVVECHQGYSHLVLKYGFNHRYHESVKEALRVVESGELGKVINARGVYGKSRIVSYASGWRAQRKYAGGGILLDQGIHMVDLLRLFCGEFCEVKSFVSNNFWKHDVEDNAYALMRAESGAIAMLHSSATQWRHRFHLEISLERGTVLLSGILSGSKSYGSETITIAFAEEQDGGDPHEVQTRYNTDPSWKDEVHEFAEAILNGTPIKGGSSDDALRTMRLVQEIYNSDPEWKERFYSTEG